MGTAGLFLEVLSMFKLFQLVLLSYPAALVTVVPAWLVFPRIAILSIGLDAGVAFSATAVAPAVSATAFLTGFVLTVFASFSHSLHAICPVAFLASKLHSYLPFWAVWRPAVSGGIVAKDGNVMWVDVHVLHGAALLQTVGALICICVVPQVCGFDIVMSVGVKIFFLVPVTAAAFVTDFVTS